MGIQHHSSSSVKSKPNQSKMVIFQRFSSVGSTESKRDSKSSKKKVSFTHEEPDVFAIDDHQNKEEIWYTEDDESEFRQRDQRMALLLTGMDPNVVKFKLPQDSTRGLEYAQPEKTKVIEQRRKNSISAVVATQKLFKKQQRDGTNSIAKAYGCCCTTAKSDAVQLASNDAQFVIDHVESHARKSASLELRQSLQKQRSERPALLQRTQGNIKVLST